MGQLTNELESARRKQELKNNLKQMGVYQTSDGRKIDDVNLYTLEWTNAKVKNDVARAYGERE